MPDDFGFSPRLMDAEVVKAALAGLTATPKTLPAKLFYDDEGCRLFYEITNLSEYYLTRTETALMKQLGSSLLPEDLQRAALVEFGGSDETKARFLLDIPGSGQTPLFDTYVPIDVAAGALNSMRLRMENSHPSLKVMPIAADFMEPLTLPPLQGDRIGFFPGSTIGNLDPDTAVEFLRSARVCLGAGSCFLLGADLRKSPEVLLPAYNDAQGVTAAFNLNLLHRLNREADADFDPANFRHQAIWNDAESRIEMHLTAITAQRVHVAGQLVEFAAGESIHTENSYKHTPETIIRFARAAGWEPQRNWTDPRRWFGIFLMRHG